MYYSFSAPSIGWYPLGTHFRAEHHFRPSLKQYAEHGQGKATAATGKCGLPP